MLSPVPDEAFVGQAKNEHLAWWWGGLVGGSTMAGKGQEKREPAALGGENFSAHCCHWKLEGSEGGWCGALPSKSSRYVKEVA